MPIPITMLRDTCRSIRAKPCEECPAYHSCRVVAERVARSVLTSFQVEFDLYKHRTPDRQGRQTAGMSAHERSVLGMVLDKYTI